MGCGKVIFLGYRLSREGKKKTVISTWQCGEGLVRLCVNDIEKTFLMDFNNTFEKNNKKVDRIIY